TGPTARIELTPAAGNAPLSVTARASASTAGSSPITGYSFAFGDGATAAGEKATHTFAQAGDYTVTVTVTDSAGRTSTASAAAHVTAAAAVGPTAQLSAGRSQATAPADIVADASASTAGSSPIADYAFTFSDGTTVGPQASATARHQVTAAGTYTVSVTVRDQAGRTSTANASVQVTAPAAAPPRAALISELPPAGGVAAQSVLRLNASGSVAGSAPITSYRFDFGDGTVEAPSADPTSGYHNYLAGTYRASVTVTDQNGQQSTATTTINRVGRISLSKQVLSTSPGGTIWRVNIGGHGSTFLVQSVSGSGIQTDKCSGQRLSAESACTVEVSVPSGTPSSVITVVSTAETSPASIELVS
ncbi:PKD domain-containing protein, partial [Frankia tisae]